MPLLTVISQVYPPDPAAVGQHLADVAEAMAGEGWHVRVLTSARGYDDPWVRYPRRERRRGVEVRRFGLSSFGKRSIAVRLLAQTLFVIQACTAALFGPKPDAILASTSPPFGGFFAALLSRARAVPLVWWVMDLNPDQMIAAGKIRPTSVFARLFDAMNVFTLARAARVVTLDTFMADRLRSKRDIGERMSVIPPWSPGEQCLVASASDTAAFRARHGLTGKFVVMYSGNHALQHPLDTLLAAAQELERDPRFAFVFVGGGGGKAAVEQRLLKGASNIVSLPYQPLERLGESLHAADVHVMSMGSDMVGIVHPCKIYGLLALGKPILMFGSRHSAAGMILDAGDTGWIVPHGDTQAAVGVLTHAASLQPDERTAIARQLRLQEDRFARNQLLASVCDVLVSASGKSS